MLIGVVLSLTLTNRRRLLVSVAFEEDNRELPHKQRKGLTKDRVLVDAVGVRPD